MYHLLQKCLYGLSMVLLQNKHPAIIQIAYLNQEKHAVVGHLDRSTCTTRPKRLRGLTGPSCVCVCVCVCAGPTRHPPIKHAPTNYTRTHARVRARVRARTHRHQCTHACTHARARMCTRTRTLAHACTRARVHRTTPPHWAVAWRRDRNPGTRCKKLLP